MGQAEEHEFQILTQTFDQRRRHRIYEWDGQVAWCRQDPEPSDRLVTSSSLFLDSMESDVLGGLYEDHFLCTLELRSALADGVMLRKAAWSSALAWDGGPNL
jgi:hypothetical protein